VKVPARLEKARAEVAQLEAERKAAWTDTNRFHDKHRQWREASDKLFKLEREYELARTRPIEPSGDDPQSEQREEAQP
jgi:hypothetical protein